jgi:hypothetical protein
MYKTVITANTCLESESLVDHHGVGVTPVRGRAVRPRPAVLGRASVGQHHAAA